MTVSCSGVSGGRSLPHSKYGLCTTDRKTYGALSVELMVPSKLAPSGYARPGHTSRSCTLDNLDLGAVGQADIHAHGDAISLEDDSVPLYVRLDVRRNRGHAASNRDQAAVPIEHASMVRLVQLVPSQLRPLEGARVLRVGHLVRLPAESRELAPPSFRHGLAQHRVGVVRQVKEGRARRPFLSLEQQRREGRGQEQGGRCLYPAFVHQRGESITRGPVPHLIVVLSRDHESVRRNAGRFGAAHLLPAV